MAKADAKHAPDSLKYQWRLYGLVSRSDWATSLDKSIAYEIIQNYYAAHGNSRASLRYLQQATRAERPNVIASVRRLVENGPFSIARKGLGTRPTEYNLDFALVAEKPSGIADDTTNADLPSGIVGDTSCGIVSNTSSNSSGIVGSTESGLRNRLTAELQEDGNIDTHAPLADGLSATAASRDPEDTREPFERFWSAFPRKYQKPKARASWVKLNPDAALAERLISVASEWAAHYRANPIEKKWMPTPANWLAGERYDEDLPSVYADPKEAASAKKRDKPAKTATDASLSEASNDNIPDFMQGSPKLWPVGEYVGEIDWAEIDDSGGDVVLTLHFLVDDPPEHISEVLKHRFCIKSSMKSAEDEGQETLRSICAAVGLTSLPKDTDDLLFQKLRAKADGRKVTYMPASRIDHDSEDAA